MDPSQPPTPDQPTQRPLDWSQLPYLSKRFTELRADRKALNLEFLTQEMRIKDLERELEDLKLKHNNTGYHLKQAERKSNEIADQLFPFLEKADQNEKELSSGLISLSRYGNDSE